MWQDNLTYVGVGIPLAYVPHVWILSIPEDPGICSLLCVTLVPTISGMVDFGHSYWECGVDSTLLSSSVLQDHLPADAQMTT